MKKKINLKPRSSSNFLIVGTVRNCSKYLKRDVERLKSAMGKVKSLHWLLIESDSSDNTIKSLRNLNNTIDNFKFISLGNLAKKMPLRTERLAYARNIYVNKIKFSNEYKNIDFVIVADLDGLNKLVNYKSIASCWSYKFWDMCSANQLGPYYDLWALRCKKWIFHDYAIELRSLNKKDPKNITKHIYNTVYSKMRIIPTNSDWIEVDSAFGGLAIYKKKCFDIGHYIGTYSKGKEVCEHVSFNLQLKKNGAKLFINPKLINAKLTEHTEFLYPSFWRKKIRGNLKSLRKTKYKKISSSL